jgi:hypothetical protein
MTEVATARPLASRVTMSHSDGSIVGSCGKDNGNPSCERLALGLTQIAVPTEKTTREKKERKPSVWRISLSEAEFVEFPCSQKRTKRRVAKALITHVRVNFVVN